MKKIFLGLLAIMVSVTLFAAPRTMEEAAQIAAQFTNQQTVKRHLRLAPRSAAEMRLVHKTNKPASEEAALYVFNKPNGGFVIVSGDDNAVEILGYSDEGSFEATNVPANVAWWLDYYAERVAVAQPAVPGVKKAHKATTGTAIAPLMTSKWNQGAPYNNLCPIDPADNTRSYTGCVATATAQIMYYYKWPEHGQGSRTYSWQSDAGGSGSESVNFANATYDWANMKNKHTTSDTQAQKTAIATLMYHVGVSCKMQYGGDASKGSGAYTSDMRTGLIQNFKYKNTATLVNNQSASAMATAFRTELAAGRPILMGGATTNNEGHEFVCDGVDADGYFHINWGWGGISDGYFALSALDPDQQGAGGASSGQGFSHDVEYVKGIEPDSNPISVTGVTVAPTSATLKIKERLQLTATVAPDNASNKGIVWSTSNANIATVSASGVVIGVAQGTATITATTNDGNKTSTCAVTVTDEVMAAYELAVDYAWATYNSDNWDYWMLGACDNATECPWVQFYFDSNSSTKIAGTYDLADGGVYLWNDPEDPNAYVSSTAGQLVVSCVGKDDGENGCNTYQIVANFTCSDGLEYTLTATLEVCAKNGSDSAIDLADNVGDGQPIDITWIANGEEFDANVAVNGKITLPSSKPANCENGKVFVGWCLDEVEATDEAPTFAHNNDVVTENTTFYAVFATSDGGSAPVETTLTMSNYAAVSGTFGNFTFQAAKNSGATAPTYNESWGDVRLYANNTLAISSESEMTQIVFNISTAGLKRLAPITASTGTIATQHSGDTQVTWTGSATSVTFTVGDNADYGSESSKAGQLDFSSVAITTGSVSYSGYSSSCSGEAPEPVYYTIRFFDKGVQVGEDQSVLKNTQPVVPTDPTACDDYTFVGWWTAELAATNTAAKAWVTNFKATKDQDYYAIYSKTEEGEGGEAAFDGNTGGTFKIYAQVGETKYYAKGVEALTSSNKKITSTTDEAEAVEYTFTKVEGGFTISNGTNYLSYGGSGTNINSVTTAYTWDIQASESGMGTWRVNATTGTNRALAFGSGTTNVFGGYSTNNITGNPVSGVTYYDLEIGGGAPAATTYYSSVVSCGATAIENTKAEVKAVKVLENGQIVIIRDNEKYTIFGQKIQ